MPSVTPDLVPPAAPLVPVFPLAEPGRPLTLYPGATGEIRVRWRLRADEVAAHGARYPPAAGAPEAVLRLGRVRAGGGTEPVRERHLRLSGLSGSGEVAFPIGEDFALFEAELGLMNPEGGWLLLARSNRLQPAWEMGLESLRRPPPGLDWGRAAGPEPDAPVGRPERAGDSRSPLSDGSAPTSVTPQSESGSLPKSAAEGPVETGPAGLTLAAVMNAIPRLTYADPVPTTAGVVIEAELRIHGWSSPNTEIDLFGQRYRVGPGGRFQLSVKVDDPELIRRALERHPPTGSGDPR